MASTTVGLVLGWVADRAVGDPARWHPVAGFGRVAAALETRTYADDRAAGARHVAALVGFTAALGAALRGSTALTAVGTWAVLGGRSLDREAATVQALLAAGDLAGARQQITHLVGRDPSGLDADELARACVESLAENTADAVVAPLFWGAVAGLPGLLAYRAINTLDAMIGHRSTRYQRFGWAAARLDDVANWAPARITAALAALLSGSPRTAWTAVRRDAHRHPSPNAGLVEAAFAGGLGVRLGGANVYDGAVEDRGTLGDGRPVRVDDIARVRRLAGRVGLGALVVTAALAAVGRR